MDIGILTHPLHTNIGGILQGFALQAVLQRQGHNVFLFNLKDGRNVLEALPRVVLRAAARVFWGRRDIVVFPEYERWVIRRNTQRFIRSHISRKFVRSFSSLSNAGMDAIVVGSDQIWRPSMLKFDIEDAYLRFAVGWKVRRISYAASLGVGSWQYSPEQTRNCSELIKCFDLVTVREDSAVGLIEEHLGVRPFHVLDPTMLLDREDYVRLLDGRKTSRSGGELLVYMLDMSRNLPSFYGSLEGLTGMRPFSVNVNVSDRSLPLRRRVQIPVEQWIRGFCDAGFVLTDSFHACVFAIIFNVPFAVVSNDGGGLARIESLLRMFGLESRLIADLSQIPSLPAVDWENVNRIWAEKREYSMGLLAGALL